MYEQNDLAVLETCITLFMWWGYSWNVLLPNPPIHITSSISSILQYFDTSLVEYLTSAGIDAGDLGWNLLSTLFSHILSKENWAVLIDFVFLHFKDAKFMVLLPVAVLRRCRTGLLQTGKQTNVQKERILHTKNVVFMYKRVS